MYTITAKNKNTSKVETYCGNYFSVLSFLSDFNYTEVEYKPIKKTEG